MPYINTETGTYPISESQIRSENPNVSFANPFEAPSKYKVVFPIPTPVHNPITHIVVEDSPKLTNKGHWEQDWDILPLAPEVVAANEANQLAQERVRLKAERTAAVENIKVTTQAGNIFDGDEVSQGRMVRAIVALQATGVTTVNWVLADNTVIQATVAELSEALALSGAAQAAVWVI